MEWAMDVRINVDLGGALASLDRLQADIRDKAAVSAVNKVADQAKTEMGRQITREFAVSAAYVRERLRVERARVIRGKAVISAALVGGGKRGRGRGANLISFVERSVSLAQARKRMAKGEGGTYKLGSATVTKALELRFKIKRTGPMKTIKGAFIGNEGRTVFIREGAARTPIKALTTIDVEQMFNTKKLNHAVMRMIEAKFPTVFANELKYYTDRFNSSRSYNMAAPRSAGRNAFSNMTSGLLGI